MPDETPSGDRAQHRSGGVPAEEGAPLGWTRGAPKWAAIGSILVMISVGMAIAWRHGSQAPRIHDHAQAVDAQRVGTRVFDVDLGMAAGLADGSGQPSPEGRRGRIDLNRATAAELELLPGIGPMAAERIVAFRAQIGGYRHVEELSRVKGIGEKTLARLRPLVFVVDVPE
jgi:competence ComEA-like helix-hairpin-helix protein